MGSRARELGCPAEKVNVVHLGCKIAPAALRQRGAVRRFLIVGRPGENKGHVSSSTKPTTAIAALSRSLCAAASADEQRWTVDGAASASETASPAEPTAELPKSPPMPAAKAAVPPRINFLNPS
jgi:hypothetical protein